MMNFLLLINFILNNKGYKLWGEIIKESFDKNLILKN